MLASSVRAKRFPDTKFAVREPAISTTNGRNGNLLTAELN